MNRCSTTSAIIAGVLILGPLSGLHAQTGNESYVTIKPGVFYHEELSPGLRWAAGYERRPSIEAGLSFQREFWMQATGRGAAVWNPAVNNEYLIDVTADTGIFVNLLRQRPVPPDAPLDFDPVVFNLGYISTGATVVTRFDQRLKEGIIGAGVNFIYRPLGLDGDRRFLQQLIPTVHLEYTYNIPVISELRDGFEAGSKNHTQLYLDTYWHFRLSGQRVPPWMQPARFDVNLQYFTKFSLEEELEEITGRRGLYYSFDLGYEITGMLPWLRYVFLRYSDGQNQLMAEDHEQFLLGITLGSTRY